MVENLGDKYLWRCRAYYENMEQHLNTYHQQIMNQIQKTSRKRLLLLRGIGVKGYVDKIKKLLPPF